MYRLAIAGVLTLHAAAAMATSQACNDVPEQGVCVSPMQVAWCEDKVLKTLECKKGTVCKWNEQIYTFDCIPVCDDVPPEGRCIEKGEGDAAASYVEWCETGNKQSLRCVDGTRCERNKAGLFDCVKTTATPDSDGVDPEPPAAADAGRVPDAAPADESSGEAGGGTADAGGLAPPRTFDSGSGEDTEPAVIGGGGGCAAGGRPGPGAGLAVLALALGCLGVIRRSYTESRARSSETSAASAASPASAASD